MILEYALRLAGVGLLLLCLANFMAQGMLGWRENLTKTDRFFQQVFLVHKYYVVYMLIGMALACLWATDELIAQETLVTRGFVWFTALFWVSRVGLHLFYYDKTLHRKHPYWNLLFLAAFIYFAATFLTTALIS